MLVAVAVAILNDKQMAVEDRVSILDTPSTLYKCRRQLLRSQPPRRRCGYVRGNESLS